MTSMIEKYFIWWNHATTKEEAMVIKHLKCKYNYTNANEENIQIQIHRETNNYIEMVWPANAAPKEEAVVIKDVNAFPENGKNGKYWVNIG